MKARRQHGFTLLEMLGTLAIGALLLAGLAGLIERSLDDMKGQQAAYYQAQVVEAARRYLDAHTALVAGGTPTAATVLPIPLARLRETRFLAAGFSDRNAFQQATCVLVRRPDPLNFPAQFDALIVTSGGAPIGDKDVAAVAMQAGSGGGYIAAPPPGSARGAPGHMTPPSRRGVACPASAAPALQGGAGDGGHLVSSLFFDGAARATSDFVYRNAVPGRPEANRMNVPLRFGGDAVAAAGASCLDAAGQPEAGIAIDGATRALLTCGPAGTWSLPSSWKAPVASFADLAPLADSAPGDVRMVTGLRRAFTYDGAGWVALAVDQDGNLDVPGTSSAGTLLARNEVRSDGGMHAVGHIGTDADVNAAHDVIVGRNVDVARTVSANGVHAESWLAAPAIEIGDTFAPGAACNYEVVDPFDGPQIAYPFGTIVMDGARRPLVCGPDMTFRYANGQYAIE